MGREPVCQTERVAHSQGREETNKNTHYGQNVWTEIVPGNFKMKMHS